ncbi:trimeric intracellular cation channel family protein [Gordonia shandongensis]|uniref:trimeric intracellular cation channel family protein n=1 Tax=Gordonia shandongensis TaxID=376351 RepID=UPI000424D3AD|nr:trimeric intracellular cation channel family protein [Gordonia shandongensis]
MILSSNIDTAASLVHHAGEFVGTAAFAASGALLAARRGLDVVGICLLAVATALGGGILRDVLGGETPPVAFTDLRYVATALGVGLAVFVWHPPARLTRWPLDATDAVGLGLFAVNGTAIAYGYGLGAPSAAMLGLTTAVGGGILRDVLAGSIPMVLRADHHLYAIPALGGAAATAALLSADMYRAWAGVLIAVAVCAVRLGSLRFGWHGPRPWYIGRGSASDDRG